MEEQKSKRQYYIVAFLFLVIIVLSIFLYSNLIDYISIIEKKELYTKLVVSDKYGFDLNGSALIFGALTPGGSTINREINLLNPHNVNTKVYIRCFGPICKYIDVSENEFFLLSGQTKSISFRASVPDNTPFGTYEGKIHIIIKNAVVK
jgi:hypothetical protein